MDNSLAMIEFEEWRDVCARLRAAKAVTVQDGESRLPARETPGQQLFAAIRTWGRAYARMAIANPDVLKNDD